MSHLDVGERCARTVFIVVPPGLLLIDALESADNYYDTVA
jgi:hypothetical protein